MFGKPQNILSLLLPAFPHNHFQKLIRDERGRKPIAMKTINPWKEFCQEGKFDLPPLGLSLKKQKKKLNAVLFLSYKVKNIVDKRENAGNQHFSFCYRCFYKYAP